ncbi:nuclear transport factor 2 family protein [Maricaulis sp.]|uniref:nuclear transport factor 2 family protein n=1 Tax=Maricaulis sp. TaxID=1486257 RepID=UPI002630B187|nr:nuclear transport factor 2 family protein [Maricaulis sp.]
MVRIFALLAALLLLNGPGLAQSEEADREAIVTLLREGPLNIGPDIDAWEANYHPDWTVWFAGAAEARQRADHMPLVRDYVARGAVVERYDLDLVSFDLFGDTAIVRHLAQEHVRDPENGLRIIDYSATTTLVRTDGRWLIRTSSLSFPAGYEVPGER